MKHRRFVARLLFLAGAACFEVRGDLIQLASRGTASNHLQVNDGAGANSITLAIVKHPFWADSFAGSAWVSYDITGDPSDPRYSEVTNETIITFMDRFFLPTAAANGYLRVMADDSTAVILNGVELASLATSPGTTACADVGIGCRADTAGFVDLTAALIAGWNTLEFRVAQQGSGAFGLDYAGSITTLGISSIPEPSSALLLATIVACVAILKRNRPSNYRL
jgi:hypothetical protein